MTEERAREILQEYRETDEETGQTYGYAVVKATEDVVVVPA